jgi:hypothetical protein
VLARAGGDSTCIDNLEAFPVSMWYTASASVPRTGPPTWSSLAAPTMQTWLLPLKSPTILLHHAGPTPQTST